MKRMFYAAFLVVLAGCLPTDPGTTDQYPAPQMRRAGYPLGGPECVLRTHTVGLPTTVTDSGSHCAKTNTPAEVLEWRWPRERNGTCSVSLTGARRVYGCIDQEPL